MNNIIIILYTLCGAPNHLLGVEIKPDRTPYQLHLLHGQNMEDAISKFRPNFVVPLEQADQGRKGKQTRCL